VRPLSRSSASALALAVLELTRAPSCSIEGTALPAQWIYTIAIDVSLLYLLYNQLSSRRRLSDLETVVVLEKGDNGDALTPHELPLGVPSSAHTALPASHFTPMHSATHGRTQVKVELPATSGLEKGGLELGIDDDNADAASPTSPTSPQGHGIGLRAGLRKKSWASFASRDSGEGGGPAWRLSWPSRAVPPRMPSAASSVFVTIETSRVCDDGAVGLWDGEEEPQSRVLNGSLARA